MSIKAQIFIVDDSPDTVWALQIYMEKSFSCELTFARTGNEAIEILKSKSAFDVIICDFMMKSGTGLDVLNFITENHLQIPFIFYSGHARELGSHKSEICVAVIDKMNMRDLTSTVGRIIGQQAG